MFTLCFSLQSKAPSPERPHILLPWPTQPLMNPLMPTCTAASVKQQLPHVASIIPYTKLVVLIISRTTNMMKPSVTWFAGGLDSPGIMVVLDDLKDLSQPS